MYTLTYKLLVTDYTHISSCQEKVTLFQSKGQYFQTKITNQFQRYSYLIYPLLSFKKSYKMYEFNYIPVF